jgi:hypothetical protein
MDIKECVECTIHLSIYIRPHSQPPRPSWSEIGSRMQELSLHSQFDVQRYRLLPSQAACIRIANRGSLLPRPLVCVLVSTLRLRDPAPWPQYRVWGLHVVRHWILLIQHLETGREGESTSYTLKRNLLSTNRITDRCKWCTSVFKFTLG